MIWNSPQTSSRIFEEEKEPHSTHDLMVDLRAIHNGKNHFDTSSLHQADKKQVTYNIFGHKEEHDEEMLG